MFGRKNKTAERLENPKGKLVYLCKAHADDVMDFMSGKLGFPHFYMTKNNDLSKKCDMCKLFDRENEALWTAHNMIVRLVESQLRKS